jgi:hypothetical protein
MVSPLGGSERPKNSAPMQMSASDPKRTFNLRLTGADHQSIRNTLRSNCVCLSAG